MSPASPAAHAPGPRTGQPAAGLAVRGLTVRFGGLTAVEDVDLDVAPGQVVALIGPNGAGKTTVFNAVCGLVRPTAGTVTLDGRPLGPTAGLVHRGVARTLQGLGTFSGLTVLENVAVGVPGRVPGHAAGHANGHAAGRKAGRTTGRSTGQETGRRDDAHERAWAQLVALGLGGRADQPVTSLPYAERATVALARALVARPRLLLLDEPAGGLGHDDIAALGRVVRDVAAAGTGVLLVEHHVDFVMGVSDHVVVLDFGRVIAAGPPEQVRRDPHVEEAYLGLPATPRDGTPR